MFNAALLTLGLLGGSPQAEFQVGDTPYLSVADSPLAELPGPFLLEDFEGGDLLVDGVSRDGGIIKTPGFNTDSVDGDDGAIDGLGLDGHAIWSPAIAGPLTFSFDAGILGDLPTAVGVAWTDGSPAATFTLEAFDAGGNPLGAVAASFGDGSNQGTTGEDRFVSVVFSEGISAITVSTTVGAIELDHLQLVLPVVTCTGDLNQDGVIDGGDIAILILAYATDDPIGDIDNDGDVDGEDLGLLLALWGTCPQ